MPDFPQLSQTCIFTVGSFKPGSKRAPYTALGDMSLRSFFISNALSSYLFFKTLVDENESYIL